MVRSLFGFCIALLLACGAKPLPAWMPASDEKQRGAIQRVVRADFESMRKCYEAGLVRDRNLAGRLAVRLVIGVDGNVSAADSSAADPPFPDPEVARCVVARYRSLHFPRPLDGPMTVVYPIVFNPAE